MNLALATERGAYLIKPDYDTSDSTVVARGLASHKVSAVLVHPDGSLFAATLGGFVFHSPDGSDWTPSYEGLTHSQVHSLAVHPEQPDVLYAGTCPAAVFKSTDRGLSWKELQGFRDVPESGRWTFHEPPYLARTRTIILHPAQPGVIFAGVEVGGLVASIDGGASWTERHQELARDLNGLAVHPGAPGRLYAVSDAGFYRSDDLGGSWLHLIKGLPWTFVESLALDPQDPDRIMLGANRARTGGGGSMFCSTDAGVTWSVVPAGLPDLARTRITAVASAPGAFFMATDGGDVFGTRDFGARWQRLESGLPPVRAMLAL